MKKGKNRLSKIIRYELICLAAVTILVAGLVKWSESQVGEAGASGGEQTASGTVVAGGQDDAQENAPSSAAESGGVKLTDTPGTEPAGGEESVLPSEKGVSVTKAGEASPTAEPSAQQPGTEPATAAPTQEPAGTPEPTKAAAPTATVAPTLAASATPTPTAAPTPTAEPTATPTPKPQTSAVEGMDTEFIASLSEPQSGEILTQEGSVRTVYYLQTDERWGSKIYGGEDTIAKYACGPTSMAIVVSSLTDIGIDPLQMSGWAYDHGYWYPQSGSLHSVVNGTAKAFGLKSEGIGNDSETPEKVKEALKNGKLVVALMGKGHFTKGGHFIVLRGITAEGKILVADCNSRDNTMTEWDFETIQSEAKWASDGGPFWIISNPNTIQ